MGPVATRSYESFICRYASAEHVQTSKRVEPRQSGKCRRLLVGRRSVLRLVPRRFTAGLSPLWSPGNQTEWVTRPGRLFPAQFAVAVVGGEAEAPADDAVSTPGVLLVLIAVPDAWQEVHVERAGTLERDRGARGIQAGHNQTGALFKNINDVVYGGSVFWVKRPAGLHQHQPAEQQTMEEE